MELSQIKKIKNRQLARLLIHLKKTGQLTPGLESDMKRSFRFVFEDVIEEIGKGHDTENEGLSGN